MQEGANRDKTQHIGEKRLIKVLFICHGNICRSPMAEFIFKDMVSRRGLSDRFHIESAATSTEEIGNPVYMPARRELAKHGISCNGHSARQVRSRDYQIFDYLLCAEKYNIRNMRWIIAKDPQNKIKRLLDFSDRPRDIDDPWYSGDFTTAYADIVEGCEAFLRYLQENKLI